MTENPSKHVQVAIIGAGPTGIGAAVGLKKRGIDSVLVIERQNKIGGIPALYKKKANGIRTFGIWTRGRMLFGEEYVQILHKRLSKYKTDIKTDSLVLAIDVNEKRLTVVNPTDGVHDLTADAIIFACGSREMTLAERGWIDGSRPERMFFTKHLLDLIDNNNTLPIKKPVIIGSDLIAYAAGAKLAAAGAADSTMIDLNKRPQCSLPERIYFRRWNKPKYHGAVKALQVVGNQTPSDVNLSDGSNIPCDGIVISGELVPNSELALLGNLEVTLPSRKPVIQNKFQLSEPGWFAAGNILGGFHGAEWCYFNGQRAARSVVKYLANLPK